MRSTFWRQHWSTAARHHCALFFTRTGAPATVTQTGLVWAAFITRSAIQQLPVGV